MNLLQYKSDEMISSTELIRKSKTIFNKLQKKEIEKAVILRDGKPQFMLLDFDTYEKLMGEYISLKQSNENQSNKKSTTLKKQEEIVDNEINKDELQKAFEQIEKLDLQSNNKPETKSDDFEIKIEVEEIDKEKQPLKDFWQ